MAGSSSVTVKRKLFNNDENSSDSDISSDTDDSVKDKDFIYSTSSSDTTRFSESEVSKILRGLLPYKPNYYLYLLKFHHLVLPPSIPYKINRSLDHNCEQYLKVLLENFNGFLCKILKFCFVAYYLFVNQKVYLYS